MFYWPVFFLHILMLILYVCFVCTACSYAIAEWPEFINKVCSALFFLFYSILFYSITLEGHRGTTDKFATIPFHLGLFSAALVELAKSIPVHSLILSSHLFFCLPLFLFPFTEPYRIVFAKPEDLET